MMCSFCGGEGCPVCLDQRVPFYEAQRRDREAREFLDSLPGNFKDPGGNYDQTLIAVVIASIQYGKDKQREERAQYPQTTVPDRFSLIELKELVNI